LNSPIILIKDWGWRDGGDGGERGKGEREKLNPLPLTLPVDYGLMTND
jgi:hypothetical protein